MAPVSAAEAEAQGRHKALALNPCSATYYWATLAHYLISWASVSPSVKWGNRTFLEGRGRPEVICAPNTSLAITQWEKCLPLIPPY